METRGITLKLAEVRSPLRQRLRAAGLESQFGSIAANASIAPLIRDGQGLPKTVPNDTQAGSSGKAKSHDNFSS